MNAGKLIPAAVAAAAIAVLVVWWTQGSSRAVVPRVSDSDLERLTRQRLAREARVRIPVPEAADPPRDDGRMERAGGSAADLPGAWPQFRGPQRDGICRDPTPLAKTWAKPPKVLWSRPVGEGHAGPAVLDGKVYLVDYDIERKADVVRCMSLETGKDIWAYSYPMAVKRDHGRSRTVPAVTKEFIVAIGPRCHVTCLNTEDGMPRWRIDLVARFGTTVPNWHTGQCPLIDAGRAILAPAGNAMLAAIDCKSGKVVWHTPNPQGWRMSHSSITPMELGGRKIYVYCSSGGVVGVEAETGKLLWSDDSWRVRMANVPAPVPVGKGRLLLSGDYDAGARMIELRAEGDRIVPKTVFEKTLDEFSARHHTPILYKGHLYSVRQDKQLACMDLSGVVKWSSGDARQFNYGPFLIAGDRIYAMDDHGLLSLIAASPDGYEELARFQAVTHAHEGATVPGHDAWAPMAMVGGRLLLRDLTKLVCLDVR